MRDHGAFAQGRAVVYRNPRAGAVTGWINVKEATGG
ncbi:hypothetical protein B1M_04821 [Burkholderia sp. TJI49]|nr:hypothetical protein B1M_04821 [Burkholderia sp. TJI49]